MAKCYDLFCPHQAKARGLCVTHYGYAKRHGMIEAYPKEGQRAYCTVGHALTPENTHVTAQGRRVCRTCQAAYNARRPPVNPAVKRDTGRRSNWRRIYGLSIEDLVPLAVAQDCSCAICGAVFDFEAGSNHPQNMCVDHDHGGGRVRGLLCRNCNLTLGTARESPEILRAAASYLEVA